MNPSQYSLDNEWISARERLIALEKHLDQMTIKYLREIGVGAEWRCLEIGAGGGSIADWLCHQVGATGHVTATDINTRFLDALDHSNLEVWQHNLESDDLPTDAFDVVHARVVLVHLKEPDRAVKKLTGAVRPGGWILLEEPDHVTTVADPLGKASSQALFNKVMKVFHAAYRQRGQDINFGNRLFGLLRAMGLEEVRAEGRTCTFQGGASEVELHRLSFQQLRDIILDSAVVSEDEYNQFLACWTNQHSPFDTFLSCRREVVSPADEWHDCYGSMLLKKSAMRVAQLRAGAFQG